MRGGLIALIEGGLNTVDSQNPTTWNMYAYANGDPVNYYDPYGSFGCSPDYCKDPEFPNGAGGANSPCQHGFGCLPIPKLPITSPNRGPVFGGGGGQPGTPMPASIVCSAPKYAQALSFINANLGYAQQIASQLNTTPGDILGLAGLESGWGTGPLIAAGTNNYFSLQAGSAFSGTIGTYQLGKNVFGIYPSPGFLSSGESFANSYFGVRVNGITNPVQFAEALNSNGNYNSENLPTPYDQTVANVINLANSLLSCPQTRETNQ
jgi:hypothetical protein